MTSFQKNYNYHIGRNYFGAVARPGEPTIVDLGIAGEDLKPGAAVLFDATDTERNYKKPEAGTLANVVGIVSYNEGSDVAQADGSVLIKSGAPVRVGKLGSFYAKPGADLETGQQVVWNIADEDWDLLTEPATYALAHRNPAFVVERFVDVSAEPLFIVRFYGQVR